MSDNHKDRLIVAQTAGKMFGDLAVAEIVDPNDAEQWITAFYNAMWAAADLDPNATPPPPARGSAKKATKKAAKGAAKKAARPRPQQQTTITSEPEAHTFEELSDATAGALITAMQHIPGEQLTDGNQNDVDIRWADCLYYNPDAWYDNRRDKAPNAPDFRHGEIEEPESGRKIGCWIDGKEPTPPWVHAILPYRDLPDILIQALNGGQPF